MLAGAPEVVDPKSSDVDDASGPAAIGPDWQAASSAMTVAANAMTRNRCVIEVPGGLEKHGVAGDSVMRLRSRQSSQPPFPTGQLVDTVPADTHRVPDSETGHAAIDVGRPQCSIAEPAVQ